MTPREGIDRCPCGAKYWDGDFCHSCGERFCPELPEGVAIRRDDDGTYAVGFADWSEWADAIRPEDLLEAIAEWADLAVNGWSEIGLVIR